MRRINRRLVFLLIVLACDVVSVFGRPQEQNTAATQLKDDLVANRREDATRPMVVFAENPANPGDARSHTTRSPPPTPLIGDSVKSVSDQLLQTSTPSSFVVSSEIRTVPKTDSSPLKGEAVPVLTDDDVHNVGPYSYKISSDGSTRPTGDLSTWILLGGEPSPAPSLNMATIKKVPKPADATASSFVVQQPYETTGATRKRKPTTTERTAVTHSSTTESPLKLQDSKFKNKTPVVVGRIPVATTAVEIEETTTAVPLPELPPLDNNTRFGTPVVTFPHVPPRQRPSANNTKKADKPLTTKVTSTAVVVSKPLNNVTVTSTGAPTTVSPSSAATASTATTTVQNSTETAAANAPNVITDNGVVNKNTTSKKKKKKNKNKNKRRPAKPSTTAAVAANEDDAQSKIDDQSTKIATLGRPLSTRIYNYLAREVMPNVGVGIVGLMLTAGLAGLLLYSPLGGAAIPLVPLRRTVDNHGHSHGNPHGSGYVPPETDNSQPEEQVFGQVLSGMSYGHHNPYGRERPADPVPKYKSSSYQPSEYSPAAAPAVHDPSPKYNGHDQYAGAGNDVIGNKFTAADSTKYTTHDGTKYAVVESTKYSGPDKYSEPDTSKYSTIDQSAPQEKVSYPLLQDEQRESFEPAQNGQDQTYQNHHYDHYDSSNAYEQQPKYQSGSVPAKDPYQQQDVQQQQQSSGSYESPKYPGYVQDVPKEDAVVYSFDNHRADDKDSSTAASSADPSYSALQGVPKFYDPAADSEQISVNVRQTMKMEHGPRSLRIRRQADEHNEVDGQLPEETTTANTPKPAAAEEQTTGHDVSSTAAAPTTTSTESAKTTPAPPNNNQYSLVDLFRRVAEMKLKMGIEILKNTAASFTQYVNAIQRRMTDMVRSLQKSNDRRHAEEKHDDGSDLVSGQRQRRSLRHRMYTN